MKYIFFLSIILMLLAFACIKEIEKDYFPLHKVFELNNGSEKVNWEGISVLFNSVTEDSRCPSDVICIWPGVAAARFTFTSSIQDPSGFILYVDSDTLIHGYRIKLIDLKPYPISTIRIDPKDYIAEIIVTKE